jgi:hypothetical protein
MASEQGQGDGGRGTERGMSGDFIAEFSEALPDWILSFHPLRVRPLVYERATKVVVIDSLLPLPEKARQVGAAIEAVLHPDDEHPDVSVIDQR